MARFRDDASAVDVFRPPPDACSHVAGAACPPDGEKVPLPFGAQVAVTPVGPRDRRQPEKVKVRPSRARPVARPRPQRRDNRLGRPHSLGAGPPLDRPVVRPGENSQRGGRVTPY